MGHGLTIDGRVDENDSAHGGGRSNPPALLLLEHVARGGVGAPSLAAGVGPVGHLSAPRDRRMSHGRMTPPL